MMGDAETLYRMLEEESLKCAKTIARLEAELADCQEAYHIQGRDKRILKAKNERLAKTIGGWIDDEMLDSTLINVEYGVLRYWRDSLKESE